MEIHQEEEEGGSNDKMPFTVPQFISSADVSYLCHDGFEYRKNIPTLRLFVPIGSVNARKLIIA